MLMDCELVVVNEMYCVLVFPYTLFYVLGLVWGSLWFSVAYLYLLFVRVAGFGGLLGLKVNTWRFQQETVFAGCVSLVFTLVLFGGCTVTANLGVFTVGGFFWVVGRAGY